MIRLAIYLCFCIIPTFHHPLQGRCTRNNVCRAIPRCSGSFIKIWPSHDHGAHFQGHSLCAKETVCNFVKFEYIVDCWHSVTLTLTFKVARHGKTGRRAIARRFGTFSKFDLDLTLVTFFKVTEHAQKNRLGIWWILSIISIFDLDLTLVSIFKVNHYAQNVRRSIAYLFDYNVDFWPSVTFMTFFEKKKKKVVKKIFWENLFFYFIN